MTDKNTRSVAVASEDDRGLDGNVSAHFGRCPYYTVADIEGGEIRAHRVVDNPNVARHQPGAMPHFIKGLGVDAIVAGGMGPRAIALFESLGVEVASGAQGNVRRALEGFLGGSVSGAAPCKDHDHGGCDGHKEEHHHSDSHAAVAGIVAVSVRGSARGIDAELDPRFGRAERFVFVDPSSGKVIEELDNPAGAQAHGAGPAAASIVAGRGAKRIVSGHFGPSAAQALEGLGVAMVETSGATVRQAIDGLSS